jgi:hypothetical protein
MDPKDRIGMMVGSFILIGIGLWAILDPGATEGFTAVGSRSGLKQLVADYWGMKLGVGLILLGGFSFIRLKWYPDA